MCADIYLGTDTSVGSSLQLVAEAGCGDGPGLRPAGGLAWHASPGGRRHWQVWRGPALDLLITEHPILNFFPLWVLPVTAFLLLLSATCNIHSWTATILYLYYGIWHFWSSFKVKIYSLAKAPHPSDNIRERDLIKRTYTGVEYWSFFKSQGNNNLF